jgi:hypothetical protein
MRIIYTEAYSHLLKGVPFFMEKKDMNNERFYRVSRVTGREYNIFDSIKILNISQAIFYLEREITLQDLFISSDKKTGKSVIVFVFLREDTKQAFDEWCKRNQN